MQYPPYQPDAQFKVGRVPAKMLFFCRRTPVYLPKAVDFEGCDLQVVDGQYLVLQGLRAKAIVPFIHLNSVLMEEKDGQQESSLFHLTYLDS